MTRNFVAKIQIPTVRMSLPVLRTTIAYRLNLAEMSCIFFGPKTRNLGIPDLFGTQQVSSMCEISRAQSSSKGSAPERQFATAEVPQVPSRTALLQRGVTISRDNPPLF